MMDAYFGAPFAPLGSGAGQHSSQSNIVGLGTQLTPSASATYLSGENSQKVSVVIPAGDEIR